MDALSVPLVAFLRACEPGLPPEGAASMLLVGCRSAFGESPSAKQTLKLLAHCGMWPRLREAEFVEALGAHRLKSRSLLRFAFCSSSSPADAIGDVLGLLRSGAAHASSDSSVKEIARGLARWRSPDAQTALLSRVMSECDSYASVGRFLGRVEASAAAAGLWASEAEAAEGLGRALRACAPSILPDFKGDGEALVACLRGEALRAIARECVADALDGEEEDADERGNLDGFVVYSEDDDDDDEDEEEGSDEDDDEEEEGEEAGGAARRQQRNASTSASGGARGASERKESAAAAAGEAPRAGAKRKRRGRGGGEEGESDTSGGSSSDGVVSGRPQPVRRGAVPAKRPAQGSSRRDAAPPPAWNRYVDSAAGEGDSDSS